MDVVDGLEQPETMRWPHLGALFVAVSVGPIAVLLGRSVWIRAAFSGDTIWRFPSALWTCLALLPVAAVVAMRSSTRRRPTVSRMPSLFFAGIGVSLVATFLLLAIPPGTFAE